MPAPVQPNVRDAGADRAVAVFPQANGVVRALRLARAFVGVAATAPLLAIWCAIPWSARLHRPLARRIMALFAWSFRLRIRVTGIPITGPGLIAANHVSWTDIVVLGEVCDAAFIAKADVAGWPILGHLTAHHGGEFLERASRADAARGGVSLIARWADTTGPHARPYVLFAEGTTGLGDSVQPFFPALFAPAAAAGVPVQAAGLRYLFDDGGAGRPLTGVAQRAVAWMGDETLVPHMLALATSAPLIAQVWFGPVLREGTRKTLASETRGAIAGWLGGGE